MSKTVSITKILVPVDGSKPSEKAAEYATDIAKHRNAKLLVIHVMHLSSYVLAPAPIEGMSTPTMTPIPIKVSGEEKKVAESYLNKVKEIAKTAKVAVETKIVENQPSTAHAITEIAEREGCDLIVMGTKGRTGIKKILLGSVASGVVTYASCPVLVVR